MIIGDECLKLWVTNNLCYSRGLICKKCKIEWFIKHNFLHYLNKIELATKFLDHHNPTIPQRVWHIINNVGIVKCSSYGCNNVPSFISYKRGYLKSCSCKCSQGNPDTKEKIKLVNIKKYGVGCCLHNEDIYEKSKTALIKRYGVDNASKSDYIKNKKKKTCLKNYGVEWILHDQKRKENSVYKKYGVNNVQQVKEISDNTAKTRRRLFYESLFLSNRLMGICVPKFSCQEYLESKTKSRHKFQCNKCNNIFFDGLEDGDVPRCPKCFRGRSFFENDVCDFVRSFFDNDSDVLENNKSILGDGVELDIYIPSKNLAIECDGLFWHGEVNGNKDKNYHINKSKKCEELGIQLLHIFEDEWIDKKEIVKSKIKNILGFVENRIYARKCEIVEDVPIKVKKKFMNDNHIQGNDNSKISIGLSYNETLVAIMTFSNKRIFIGYKNKHDGNKKEFELSRYAALKDYKVIGGAGKLLSYFIKTYNPEKIISYADKRWTKLFGSNLYEKIGFKKVNDGIPNYWYFGKQKEYKRFHRFGFRKDVLKKRLSIFDPNLTEWENMKNNGYDRIWDCGSLKFEMVF